jgi:hypothetical protein
LLKLDWKSSGYKPANWFKIAVLLFDILDAKLVISSCSTAVEFDELFEFDMSNAM